MKKTTQKAATPEECKSKFSEETQNLLKEAFAREGMAATEIVSGKYKCVTCNTSGFRAQAKFGLRRPQSHMSSSKYRNDPRKSGLTKTPRH